MPKRYSRPVHTTEDWSKLAHLNNAPSHITCTWDEEFWVYVLHFSDIPLDASVAVMAKAHATFVELRQMFGPALIAANMGYAFGGEVLQAAVHGKSAEQALGLPIYQELRRHAMPRFYHTAQSQMKVTNRKTCEISFRLLASDPAKNVEGSLTTGARSLGFQVHTKGLDHVITVTDGLDGHRSLVDMFAQHSVYLPLLTEQEARMLV